MLTKIESKNQLKFRLTKEHIVTNPVIMRAMGKREWFSDLFEQPGKQRSELAELLDIGAPRITDIINGERNIKAEEIPRIARYFDVDPLVLLDVIAGEADPILLHEGSNKTAPLIGYVEAGVYGEATEIPYDDQTHHHIPTAVQGFENVFALEVRGESMNQVFPHGSILFCVKPKDDAQQRELVYHGQYVIVRRHGAHGFESTVKQIEITPTGETWAWPRSDDNRFKTPWQIHWPSDDHEHLVGGGQARALLIDSVVVAALPLYEQKSQASDT